MKERSTNHRTIPQASSNQTMPTAFTSSALTPPVQPIKPHTTVVPYISSALIDNHPSTLIGPQSKPPWI
ncbi:hypothetical protein BDV41DRAFT_539224 [Aspergillus transmontanensis]|uniref:Uncharacterized protein n=1 Tax=Aspergillus transmontanensis TaxID=1034304 RepID=A0A5N6VVN8_9EURO|nr:hypothetical protein BDV41DRAFT_539224 [Aspergillus transmontanensis]